MILAIVPAYNEEKRIGAVIERLLQHCDQVVVIDDGSHDNTSELARSAGATVLIHEINRGQGAAFETGHEYARRVGATHVVHFDGDGQFHVEDIAPALAKLTDANADILFGSRFLGAPSWIPPFKRYLLLPLGRMVDRFFGGLRLTDSHNGFRILSQKALEVLRITQDRMAHASEIPALVKQHRLRYVEFPVRVTYHEYGQRASGGLLVLKDLALGRFLK